MVYGGVAYINAVNSIIIDIQAIINRYRDDILISMENRGCCIGAHNTYDSIPCNETMTLWIRIMPYENNKLTLDISSIQLPLSLRNHGVFTKLMKRLKQHRNVGQLMVTSVCTKEMFKWCYKHKDDMPLHANNNYLCNFSTNASITGGMLETWRCLTEDEFIRLAISSGYLI